MNRIADAIAAEFPKVIVSTLAYEYSRRPPSRTRPRPNVAIRLCNIEADFGRKKANFLDLFAPRLADPKRITIAGPMTDPRNQAFAADLRGWHNQTRAAHLHVWSCKGPPVARCCWLCCWILWSVNMCIQSAERILSTWDSDNFLADRRCQFRCLPAAVSELSARARREHPMVRGQRCDRRVHGNHARCRLDLCAPGCSLANHGFSTLESD